MHRVTASLVLLALPTLAVPSQATDRVLRKETRAAQLARQQPQVAVEELTKKAPECTRRVLKGYDVAAYRCQILMLHQAAKALDVGATEEKARDKATRKRVELSLAALALGQAVADYSPVNRIEGLDRLRFETMALACQPLGELFDTLNALPADHPSAAMLHSQPSLPKPLDQKSMKDVVCSCASTAVDMAGAAFVPPSDLLHNDTQRSLYARGCFLDVEAGRSSLVDVQHKSPGVGPSSAPDRPAVANRAADLARVATTRDFQLGHCRERLGQRRQRSVDQAGLERCVCEVANKWRFSRAEGEATAVELVLVPDKVRYTLTVEADGKVSACSVALVEEKK
ncbi:MAG: hypothetical protein ABIJ09_10995 [Pseudomonadota bacterium]